MTYDNVKVTKNQGFTLSLKNTFLEKQGEGGEGGKLIPSSFFVVSLSLLDHAVLGQKFKLLFKTDFADGES